MYIQQSTTGGTAVEEDPPRASPNPPSSLQPPSSLNPPSTFNPPKRPSSPNQCIVEKTQQRVSKACEGLICQNLLQDVSSIADNCSRVQVRCTEKECTWTRTRKITGTYGGEGGGHYVCTVLYIQQSTSPNPPSNPILPTPSLLSTPSILPKPPPPQPLLTRYSCIYGVTCISHQYMFSPVHHREGGEEGV